jgi:hypothetical protein
MPGLSMTASSAIEIGSVSMPDSWSVGAMTWDGLTDTLNSQRTPAPRRCCFERSGTVTGATEQDGVRPEESSLRYAEQAGERGRRAGAAWAEESAEYLDLQRLAAIAVQRGVDDEQAGYWVVSTILGERHLSRREIAAFRETFGLEHDDADAQNQEYWRGFLQSALEVFEEVEI